MVIIIEVFEWNHQFIKLETSIKRNTKATVLEIQGLHLNFYRIAEFQTDDGLSIWKRTHQERRQIS